MKKTAALLSFLLVFTAAAPAETARSLIDSLHTAIVPSGGAAERSVGDLQGLSRELPDLQLVTVDKGNILSRGQSFPIVTVELDRLRAYDSVAQPDPTALLVTTNRAFYFVTAPDEGAVSGVEVMRDGQDWFPARLGLTKLAADVQTTLDHLDIAANHAILIEIPAFRLWFVGYDDGGKMQVASIESAPELDITKNLSRPLDAVFKSLVQKAKEHNGLSS